jgi:hypothetical protein
MRPYYYYDEIERLRKDSARAKELRSEGLMADYYRPDLESAAERHPGMLAAARAAAGRGLVGLGHRVFPGDMEPCSDA